MDSIAESSILIGARQRQDDVTEHVKALAKEIEETELLHAIALTSGNRLVAGFCRLSAIRLLYSEGKTFKYNGEQVPSGHVPFIKVFSDDEETLFRIELMENLRRRNLSPMDEALAVTELHKRQQTRFGDSWSMKNTGELVDDIRGKQRESTAPATEVADSILLSGFADDKDVKGAKTRREAVRIAKKKAALDFLEVAGQLASLQPQETEGPFILLHGDMTQILPALEVGSFAGIVTDPPYGIDADTFGEQSSAEGHVYEDTVENAIVLAKDILLNGFHLCRDGAHLYMFCDVRNFSVLERAARAAGWLPFSTPLIWHKPGLGHAPQPGFFGRRYECILFARKGSRGLSSVHSDVFQHAGVKDKIHAAQKPVELLREILNLSFYPGDHILDPCCGSGSLFAAAHLAKMKVTGIEKEERMYNLAQGVIGGLK